MLDPFRKGKDALVGRLPLPAKGEGDLVVELADMERFAMRANRRRQPVGIDPVGGFERGFQHLQVAPGQETRRIRNEAGIAAELDGAIDAAQLAAAIKAHFNAFDVIEGENEVALAFRWRGEPSFERLSAFGEALKRALANTIHLHKPVYLILDGDVAQTLGAILKEDWGLKSEVLVIDGVALRDFDYIDLGRIRVPSNTVPVTIKSLVFSQDHRVPHRHAHHHHDQ